MQRLFDDGFSKGDLSVADEMVAPDCKEHQYFGPNHPDGPEGHLRMPDQRPSQALSGLHIDH